MRFMTQLSVLGDFIVCKKFALQTLLWSLEFHCVKNVRIRSFSCQYYPTFRLNTERYGVSLRILSKYGKMWTRKTPNTDTFHAVFMNFTKTPTKFPTQLKAEVSQGK